MASKTTAIFDLGGDSWKIVLALGAVILFLLFGVGAVLFIASLMSKPGPVAGLPNWVIAAAIFSVFLYLRGKKQKRDQEEFTLRALRQQLR